MKAQWIAVGAALAVMTGVGASAARADEGSFFNDADYKASGRVESNSGVIAAGNREAALAGAEILKDGGNAVDAAAATLFAVGVAGFESCGIGGGGFMVYRSADGQVVDTIDFREQSPAQYTFSDIAKIGDNGPAAWGTGHNVVGIPGAVAGMDLALRKHGSGAFEDPWKAVLQPAIDLAEGGFTVSKFAGLASDHPRLAVFPTSAAIYYKVPEQRYKAREKMRNLPLADDMRELQRLGPDAFYDPDLGDDTLALEDNGTIADDLLAEMNRPSPYDDQAVWTEDDLRGVHDLSGYEAISRPAVRTRYRGSEYIGMGAPSSAGTAIAQVLNILEGYDLRAAGQSSADHVHFFAEAMKLAWRDRAEYLGDPAFTPTPGFLTSKEYAGTLRDQIDPKKAQAFPAPGSTEGGTHNIAVIDKDGNAVALNCSIEQPMGSAVTAAGTGFLLNSQLTDFESPTQWDDPSTAPEGPGLWPTEEKRQRYQNGPANGWAPGKRPRSSMAPSIVVRQGVPVLVAGGVGGPSIIGGTAAAVLNVVDFRQSVAQAIDAERSDPRGNCPDRNDPLPNDPDPAAARQALQVSLCLETTRFDNDVLTELLEREHRVLSRRECVGVTGDGLPDLNKDWKDWPDDGLQAECEYAPSPLTHAAGIAPASGLREAASDPRALAWAVRTASQEESRALTANPNPGDLTGLAAVSQPASP